jgi:hypothetical protein
MDMTDAQAILEAVVDAQPEGVRNVRVTVLDALKPLQLAAKEQGGCDKVLTELSVRFEDLVKTTGPLKRIQKAVYDRLKVVWNSRGAATERASGNRRRKRERSPSPAKRSAKRRG